MLHRPPNTWTEVPAAVRAAILDPFIKAADDGTPGLSTAADVLGWRAGDLNANWGGPRPLTNLLIGAGLGSLGGYGVGRLAEQFLPERYFTPGGLRRRGAILGGALLAAPAAYQAFDNIRQTGELGSVLDPWPQMEKANAVKRALDIFEPRIHRTAFSQAVFGDPNTPPALQAATAGLTEAASAVRGSDWVSPFDVAKIAVGAGAGLVSGLVAGKALGILAGLTPQAQQGVQQIGLWSGVLNSVVPPALKLR
jgi:hypothetical protein